jgi:intein/homing endonuclease
MNKSIARCIARLSGDGNIYLGKNGKNGYIRYSNTCRTLREQFKSDLQSIFGNIVLTEGVTNTNTPFVQVHRKQVVRFFLQYLDSYKSKNILVPNKIKLAPKVIKAAYLSALYDDEGSPRLRIFKLQEWKRNLTLYSNSEKLLKEVKNILEQEFDINCNKIYTDLRYDGRISFALDITGKKNFEAFKQSMGFSHPEKIKTLQIILKSYNNTVKRNKSGFLKLKELLNL